MLKKTLTKAPLAKSVASAPKAPVKKSLSSAPSPAVAPDEAEGEDEAPDTAEAVKVKASADAKPNEEVVTLIEAYDTNVKAAETSFIELVEHIQENQIDRPTVFASLMKARGMTFEAAQKEYGKMKKIFNNEEVLADLKAGKITLKVAREKVKTEQKNPASAKPEAKEQKFTKSLDTFLNVAKETGFAWKEILVTIEAERKNKGIK